MHIMLGTDGTDHLYQNTDSSTYGSVGSRDKEWSAGLIPKLALAEPEIALVHRFHETPALTSTQRITALARAREVATVARQTSKLFSAEKIMTVYKLSTAEGRLIMELAEALLRVPDKTTRDFLIFDNHFLEATS